MQRIAKYFTDFFVNKGGICEDERAIYEYGFDITLYTILSTLGLLLIGLLFHQLANTIVLVFVFYSCQSSGGGYHASTHLRCFLTMCTGLLFGLAFQYIPFPDWLFLAIGASSILLLLIFPLTLHPNKSYLKADSNRLIRRSMLTTVFITCLCSVLLTLNWIPASIVSSALLLSAFSRLYAIPTAVIAEINAAIITTKFAFEHNSSIFCISFILLLLWSLYTIYDYLKINLIMLMGS